MYFVYFYEQINDDDDDDDDDDENQHARRVRQSTVNYHPRFVNTARKFLVQEFQLLRTDIVQ